VQEAALELLTRMLPNIPRRQFQFYRPEVANKQGAPRKRSVCDPPPSISKQISFLENCITPDRLALYMVALHEYTPKPPAGLSIGPGRMVLTALCLPGLQVHPELLGCGLRSRAGAPSACPGAGRGVVAGRLRDGGAGGALPR
jgi:hypothetical protein